MRTSNDASKISRTLTIAMIGVLATSVSSCATSDDDSASDHVALQFSWHPNVENMAQIVAKEKGFFEEEGLDAEILPSGPEVAADAQVVSGNADMATLTSESLAAAVANGAPLVGIGATYQTSPSIIMTKAGSGINSPKDLENRTFGVSQVNYRVYEPFFKSAGVDVDKVKMIDTGADPAALVSGEVDAMADVLPNGPVVLSEKNIKTQQIALSDYGYNRWSGVLTVKASDLNDTKSREKIVAIAKATEKGLEYAVDHPEEVGEMVYEKYGKDGGLSKYSQVEGAKKWADMVKKSNRTSNYSYIDSGGVRDQQEFFDNTGIKAEASQLYDTEFSSEVFGKS